jgi:hypothetical protein
VTSILAVMFAGKAGVNPSIPSPKTSVEVTDSYQYTILLHNSNNYGRRSFVVQACSVNVMELSCCMIYDLAQ